MMYNPLLLIDFYKACHPPQYPEGMTKLVEYYTPRMSRLKDVEKVGIFGVQGLCKEYLIEAFNMYFFSQSEEFVVKQYKRVLDNSLGTDAYEIDKIRALHQLGYLPIMISALPEGTRTKIGVPQLEITNTHPDFAWLVGTLETAISNTLWHTQVALEVGYRYRQIVNKYHEITCEDSVEPARLLGDFSMRGQHSNESAIKASAAWCLSFLNTATVPAILWLEDNYNCDCEKEPVAYGAISTEHSVMCSNAAIDGDEITHIKRLLTEIYPNQSFSMVSDSYDYWNLVDNILPKCKEEIMNHNGTLSVRGDSGDPVQVVTETVFHLWEHFGGTINSKGYKVLDPHVKAIYGDSITPQRCEAIYQILEEAGFSIQNVSLGVGSFSFMCLEEFIEDEANWESGEKIVKYNPYTRDTFGVAVKATYMEDKDGNPIPIFKNPKEASFKKSQKGCCSVYFDEKGEYTYKDNLTYAERIADSNNALEPVFANGKMIKEYSLQEIRANLHKGEF